MTGGPTLPTLPPPPIDADGLRARGRVLAALRRWFDAHGYVEVQTPVRVPSAAMEANLFPLEAQGAWLRTSPEFALKRVLAEGLGRVVEIGPCFRGREQGPWHATEFTMIEWYRVGAELGDLMDEVEALVREAAHAVGRPVPSWRRVTVRELVRELAGVDLATATAGDLSHVDSDWDEAFFRLWVDRVEPRLEGALFVTDWPASQAALARVRDDGPWPVACRFEAYLHGVELANAFLELTDPQEQRRRTTAANGQRQSRGEVPHPIDEALLKALGRMPRTAGIAMGFDRLLASVMGWPGIARGRVDNGATAV